MTRVHPSACLVDVVEAVWTNGVSIAIGPPRLRWVTVQALSQQVAGGY